MKLKSLRKTLEALNRVPEEFEGNLRLYISEDKLTQELLDNALVLCYNKPVHLKWSKGRAEVMCWTSQEYLRKRKLKLRRD